VKGCKGLRKKKAFLKSGLLWEVLRNKKREWSGKGKTIDDGRESGDRDYGGAMESLDKFQGIDGNKTWGTDEEGISGAACLGSEEETANSKR